VIVSSQRQGAHLTVVGFSRPSCELLMHAFVTGASKLSGEGLVQAYCIRQAVLRTVDCLRTNPAILEMRG
jgi:hypothetical protein